ncbi:beta-ketoacyl-ACP synthase [Endozoicomonas sp.]|uniref:beta-ketoacyl-ACP synthase n=1 Tax=Endozoicomonas sp. TaxID=1892382 RepID=UPI0028861892|nr:beta-ketoacyl-ACP synthase [Endozoicomonas sp.]
MSRSDTLYGKKRVVVTGMSTITSIGHDWQTFSDNLKAGKTGIRIMPEWQEVDGLNTALAGPVNDFSKPAHYPRKKTRGMGRVALMSTVASECALKQAGLLDDPFLGSGYVGVAYGSSTGSTAPIVSFGKLLESKQLSGVNATSYIQMMPHTTAVNVALFFGLRGRLIPTSSACTSGSQAIGLAYEAIADGRQDIMVAGGAEELCVTEAAVFDTLFATSTRNETPELTPRPFDRDRDGLVIGEGAGTLVLEELERAKSRGATILAEIVGFGTNMDGMHITQPTAETMAVAMKLALEDAGIPASAIGYVNAHGTATDRGDIAESHATHSVFGSHMPISSLKSYLGHTLGACGAIEAWASINMLNNDWYAPTINLNHIDPECAELDYIMDNGRSLKNEYVMSNNFAFGGVNTSLIFKRW